MNNSYESVEGLPQSPSDLQVIEFQYQHVGHVEILIGMLVVIPPEYRWLLGLDDNPQAYGQVWEDFNDSAVVIEYVDVLSGETVESTIVSMLTPDSDEFYIVATDRLIQQLTPIQVLAVWKAVSDDGVVLPQSVDRLVFSAKLWDYLIEIREEYIESTIQSALAPYIGIRVTEGVVTAIQDALKGVLIDWVDGSLIPCAAHMEYVIAKVPNLPMYMNEDISMGGLKKLEHMAEVAMNEYHAGLTQDSGTL